MALMKCSECGKEMSDKALNCPHCGHENTICYCTECGAKVKKSDSVCPSCGAQIQKESRHKTKKLRKNIVFGIAFIILGVISVIWGLTLGYIGNYESASYYGGDAYTGIQNAAATTANNVDSLGEVVCSGLKGIMIVSGGTLITIGIYSILKKESK